MKIFCLILAAIVTTLVAMNTQAQSDRRKHDHEAHAPVVEAVGEKSHSTSLQRVQPTVGPHGGPIEEIGKLQLETVVGQGGLQLFVYNHKGQPLDLRNARGLVTLQASKVAKRYRYDLFPEIGLNKKAESLAMTIDLSRLAGQQINLVYQLVGLQGNDRKPLKFSVKVTLPSTKSQRVAAAIMNQKVCPVSEQPLGSMGKAIPVTIGDQTLYVCCAGCTDAIKANPAKYFAKLAPQPEPTVGKAAEHKTTTPLSTP